MNKYDSSINVLGSIPDYSSMIDFICESNGYATSKCDSFAFRTHKTFLRFNAAISVAILQFSSPDHKRLFLEALSSDKFSIHEKLLILFWQLTYGNLLFRRISDEVFMTAVYQGRFSLTNLDIESWLRHLKETEKDELTWSEKTIKTSSSKCLTLLKKLELMDGRASKTIRHPIITSSLFTYFIRWALTICPDENTISNPYMRFSFMEKENLIINLKRVEHLKDWDLSQIGDSVTIYLKDR